MHPLRLCWPTYPQYSGYIGYEEVEKIPELSAIVHELQERHEMTWMLAGDHLGDTRDVWVLSNTPRLPPLLLKEDEKIWVNIDALTPTE